MQDIYTGKDLCAHPSCRWSVDDGWAGIEARYEDKDGNPACWSHRDPSRDEAEE